MNIPNSIQMFVQVQTYKIWNKKRVFDIVVRMKVEFNFFANKCCVRKRKINMKKAFG